ncbi:MAG TPA: oligopeptide transporter, OPT family [Tenuifilaceae bacterium]|jgi:putative OPT family oligopeptide transporter|nr:oligopeptide transporter, OPT family [Bacteroidales bacterium]MDI9517037.1 oligopeptide transporter, OPT family [Bacteroidota bacterium]NLH55370.1 oligopeptide transporter, OPT family [Rikenellaceae bacterium]OQC62697.1 MAG: OPT oligopeptide transporter protein [Bacteroidetes bacterium ADurb.Bin008]HOF91501.1 oligopeptide transporter, OPT family [Tenuifilaceae bacterium]
MTESKKFVPFVSSETNMKEFTLRALIIGLVMSVILGAANAYLGLKAGMTIAAVYPAAVVGMAILKLVKGSILEENIARTVGAIGESVAAGAIFTLPAFFVAGLWDPFYTPGNYITSTIILIAGGFLGIMFVALLRRVMVESTELPFPESVAAAEIHKAGRTGGGGSKFLFQAMIVGAIVKLLAEFKLFATAWERFIIWGKQTIAGSNFTGQGGMFLGSPGVSPAYVGVGYIIGPNLGALAFSGGIIAWGLLTPIILYFIGPSMEMAEAATSAEWLAAAKDVWARIVRPIAIGGMLVGAAFTLYKMRNSLIEGIARSIRDVKKAATGAPTHTDRIEKDISFTFTIIGIIAVAIVTWAITFFIFKTALWVAIVVALMMTILAFFFAAVSGYLVGLIGSSNNPISGLTLTALLLTALVLVILGIDGGDAGVAAVLGVAAIVCVAAAVAGEMLQDLKTGHILGGTPWKMEIGNIIGVVASGAIMFFILTILNDGDIARGNIEGYVGGFGSQELPAPQASLMAILSRGIVGGEMAWPLIIVGMFMGIGFILMRVKSPMLVSVGMYLPLTTTFAIFTGGITKGIIDMISEKRKHNQAQKQRIENVGVLLASGLIAGEALMGLVVAMFAVAGVFLFELFSFFKNPAFLIGFVVIILVAVILIVVPLRNAGNPEDPAPPSSGH